MWETTLLLFVVFASVLSENAEIFDVTTIFERWNPNGRARIHSRTNALGLPLSNPEKILSPNLGLPNITCDFTQDVCSWKLRDWSTKKEYFTPRTKYFYTFKNGTNVKISDGHTKCQFFVTSSNKLSEVAFMTFHVVTFETRIHSYGIFNKNCDLKYGYTYDKEVSIDGQILRMSCRYYDDFSTEIRANDTYSFYFDDYISGSVSGSYYGGGSRWKNDIYQKYIYFDNVEGCTVHIPEKDSIYPGNEIISPNINVDSKQMCMVVVFRSPDNSSESLFGVFAEDSFKKRHFLQAIKNAKAGWNIAHLNLTIPETITGTIKLIVGKTSSKDIFVARVSNCNPEEEDVALGSTPTSTDPFSSSLYTVTAQFIAILEKPLLEATNDNATICLNGGAATNAGCACRPGFHGSQCQLGCGRNRFGQDCGGLCSSWKSECEGLMLCTNPTGCQCAPGYEGSDCKTKCSDGWYGNDCSQRCGRCAVSSTCDIYTGECVACEDGYLPPHCRYESVYYPVQPLLSSPEYGTIQVTFDPDNYVATSGTPTLFQIQYRNKVESSYNNWKIYANKKIQKNSTGSGNGELTSENIEGLKDGIAYEVKVLFMDENFYKYDGDHVKTAEIITKCEIPQVIDYKVEVQSYVDSLIFSWNYGNTSLHWCPVDKYEVTWRDSWQRFTNYTQNNFMNFTDLLAGAKISFKVHAKTSTGFAPYSDIISAYTLTNGFPVVQNLQINSSQSSSAEISWNPPIGIADPQLQYIITYKCVEQPSCSSSCQNVSEGEMTVKGTRITIRPLAPFTRYLVTVSPQNGQEASIYVGTPEDVPTEVPSPSSLSPVRTNTSVTVFWEQPEVCSGFLLGYNYQLVKELESLKLLDSGFTKDTSVSFHNLTASTQYIVRVSVVTIGGWDPESFLAINISTSATVPGAVRNLTVYKRSKEMLGLRWAPPQATYGQLKSFTVIYTTLGQDPTSHTVEPTPCVVWPELFCYTIEGLGSNRRYNVSVSARNVEIVEDGEVRVVTGVTKEASPTAPQHLKLVNSSSSSILLQWNYPELANGVVRTFVISVEETENHDQENCCQIYPLVETQVEDEAQTYESEVSGLHPASTYFVSVSAKTVGMGPSQSLVVQTRPPHLPLTYLPRVVVPSLEQLTWLPQQTLPDVNNVVEYTSLIKAHLLLVVVNESQPIKFAPDSGITDLQLNSLLENVIEKPFYFVAEYNQVDVVTLAGYLESVESSWGHPPPSLPTPQKYQLAAVQVSEYNGAFNTDLRLSQPFTLAY